MKLRLLPVLAFAALATLAGATPPVDLGQGLSYLRVEALGQSQAELGDALRRPSTLIVDLRYTAKDTEGLDALRALVREPASPKLYVLVSPETPRPIADVIGGAPSRIVVLGVPDSRPAPQVVVEQPRKEDRLAYDALAQGTSLADLISGKVDKERYDEASLVQEFKNGNHDARPPTGPAAAASAPARPTDRVLQRAVHLHRALQALRRG